MVGKGCFPDSLKEAEVIPVFKDKDDSNDKSNYRPISCLPPLAKVFEKLVFKQLSPYFENIFSPILSGFRKGYNTQSALLRIFEIWHEHLDKVKTVGAILMDLSKAFGCVRHDSLIAKLSAYGLSEISLRPICSYLSYRSQRVKANSVFSDSLNLKSAVPQGSILGPLVFNIYLNDLFYFVDSKICNYADDNTIFAASHDPNEIKSQLQQSLKCISEWFQINYFVLNLDKCKLLLIHHRNLDLFDDFSITVDGITTEPSSEVKILGVTVDSYLNLNSHISKICKKAASKLCAISRLKPYLQGEKLILLVKSYVTSQFNYCPLLWAYTSRRNNNKINSLYEKRALRLVEGNSDLDFEELLVKYRCKSNHTSNISQLMLLLYKCLHNIGPSNLQEIFHLNSNSYNIRNCNEFKAEHVRTVNHGTETVSFRGPQTWGFLKPTTKSVDSVEDFTSQIKSYEIFPCKCRLCTTYVQYIGYI